MAEKLFIGIDSERVEATGDDLQYLLQARAEIQAVEDARDEEAQAKEDSRLSAIAKLQALGLTVDEVQVAFGLKA